ncbi:hypothetical protein HYPSUDRAFT_817742 [Hypholoma sublateritium FD-334 SS-4]|uniref:Secreted protein n=1 Tax=Hypholoma sublateritium (strain FD-334 SS-4) TaxID=945553 RepID=A0A0D2L110_HYPSF|nr:hypothetical protein HYPSUDRAFT_817742 [Hypholoma sublateritium FD-334 SS-4]
MRPSPSTKPMLIAALATLSFARPHSFLHATSSILRKASSLATPHLPMLVLCPSLCRFAPSTARPSWDATTAAARPLTASLCQVGPSPNHLCPFFMAPAPTRHMPHHSTHSPRLPRSLNAKAWPISSTVGVIAVVSLFSRPSRKCFPRSPERRRAFQLRKLCIASRDLRRASSERPSRLRH